MKGLQEKRVCEMGDEMENKILVIFRFETGDASVPLWDVCAVIEGGKSEVDEIEDSLTSYLEAPHEEDDTYDETVENVLSASGYAYRLIDGAIPACKGYRIITV